MKETTSGSHKEVDFLIRGGGPLSLAFAMNLLRQRQEVLFYYEQGEQEQNEDFHLWGELEVQHLELLGQKLDSKVLSNVHNYLEKVEIDFICGERRISLGNEPWKNFFQIYRKFPKWFDTSKSPQFSPREIIAEEFRSKFNSEFQNSIKRVSENCFRYRNFENLTSTLFETHCPEFIIKIANAMSHFMRQETIEGKELRKLNLEEQQFLLGLRFLFQRHLDLKWGKVEIYHFLFSLLGSRYRLDIEKLMHDLQLEFCKFGGFWGEPEIFNAPPFYNKGFFLETANQQFKAEKCFSFINTMTKSDRHFSSSDLVFDNSKPSSLKQIYIDVEDSKVLNPRRMKLNDAQWTIEIDPNTMGGDLGIWFQVPDSKNKRVRFYSWVRETNCLDPLWYKRKAYARLNEMGLLKRNAESEDLTVVKTGGLAYINHFSSGSLSFEAHLPSRLSLSFFSSPNRDKISDGFYFGKKRGSLLGTFGAILEVKDVSYWAEKT